MIKAMALSVLLGVSLQGGCGPDDPAVPCGKTPGDGFVFDAWGQCCHRSQLRTDEHREEACDFSLPVTADTPDAGTATDCEDGLVAACVPAFLPDAGADGGACVVTNVTVCPASQTLQHDPDRCVDRDAPDAGTCPELPDAGACPVCPDPSDAGTCPAVACPQGQTYDAAQDRCRDLVEACRYTCSPGKVLTEACQCIDLPALCPTCPNGSLLDTAANRCVTPAQPPGPCPDGQARTNGGDCVVIPAACLSCPPGQLLDTGTGQCVTPPAACKTCAAGAYLDTASQQCVVPPSPPGPCPTGQARDNAGTCVVIPTACKTCPTGQLLDTGTQQCVSPTTAPAPRLEARFLVKPEYVPGPTASINQADVPFGTVELRNAANALPAEVTEIPFAALAADDPAGPYAIGGSGSVLAKDHLAGCTLKGWPPSTAVYGPATVGTDGRVRFAFAANALLIDPGASRLFDARCTFTSKSMNGGPDAFALDPEAPKGNVLNGTQRTALAGVTAIPNGNPPTLYATLGCGFVITASPSGAQVQVLTKPSYALASGSPSGRVTAGWVPLYAFTESAPSCGADVKQRSWSFTLRYTDRAGSGWINAIANNPAQRVRVADGADASTGIASLGANSPDGATLTLSASVQTAQQTVRAGAAPRTIWVYANIAGAASGDTVQIVPNAETSWYGTDAPSGYPAYCLAPDFAAAAGNVITVQ